MKTLAVIPARYASTRLPGKPLVVVGGIPLVVRVFRGLASCRRVDRVVVAVDDDRVAKVVRDAGGEAVFTPPDLPSGGDRVAYVAEREPSFDLVVNVQVPPSAEALTSRGRSSIRRMTLPSGSAMPCA